MGLLLTWSDLQRLRLSRRQLSSRVLHTDASSGRSEKALPFLEIWRAGKLTFPLRWDKPGRLRVSVMSARFSAGCDRAQSRFYGIAVDLDHVLLI